jgi:hypothetical protein
MCNRPSTAALDARGNPTADEQKAVTYVLREECKPVHAGKCKKAPKTSMRGSLLDLEDDADEIVYPKDGAK